MEAFRTFSVNKGEVQQNPPMALFYSRVIEKGGFSIKLLVGVYLEHGLIGKDVGIDRFLAVLEAVDLESGDIPPEHRSSQTNRRRFAHLVSQKSQEQEAQESLLAWLRSPCLEESVRIGLVRHPPAPGPSSERNLARALFLFADELESFADRLKEDREARVNMCPSSKKKTQSEL
jgi:hypothetical protein